MLAKSLIVKATAQMFIFVKFYLFSVLGSLSIHEAYGRQNVT